MTRRLLKLLALPLLLAGLISPNAALAACGSPAGVKGEFFYNDDFAVMQFCDGTNWIGMYGGSSGGGSGVTDGDKGDISVSGSGASWMIDDDVLDFTELKDTLTLDTSTGIVVDGANVLSITNTGTGRSFVVNDQDTDTTPFVIDQAGNVGIGVAAPTQALDVNGKVKADSLLVKVQTGLAAPTGGLALGWSTDGTHVWRATGNVGIGTATPLRRLHVGDFTGSNEIEVAAGTSGYGAIVFGDGTTGSDPYRGFLKYDHATDAMSMATAASDRITILNNGNVGIGTVSPGAALDVYKDVIDATLVGKLRLLTSGGRVLKMGFTADSVAAADFAFIDFSRNSVARNLALQTTGGNVGIGTTTPGSLLDIRSAVGGNVVHVGDDGQQDADPSYGAVNIVKGPATGWTAGGGQRAHIALIRAGNRVFKMGYMANSSTVLFGDATGGGVAIDTAGNVGIGVTAPTHILQINGQGRATNSAWATSSDRRVKRGIEPLAEGLGTVMKLRPVSFEYVDSYKAGKSGMDGKRRGFIAQEVEAIIPDMVQVVEEKFGDQEIKDFRVLNNSDFTPMLIKAVQELKADNDNLRAEFEAYKAAHP